MTGDPSAVRAWVSGGSHAELRRAARAAARAVEAEAPGHFRRRRLDPAGLASDLGIKVRTREGLPARARWHRVRMAQPAAELRLWDDSPPEVDVIEIASGAGETIRRFALVHEIGHVVLHRQLGAASDRIPVATQERFANAFAAELLIPRLHRPEIAAAFRQADDPTGPLRLASSLGISPRTLLRFAAANDWLRDVNRVWLDVRSVPNRYTNRDRRLRVYDAVLDRATWFLPRNRSIVGLAGSDAWLTRASANTCGTNATIEISRRTKAPPVRFVRSPVPAEFRALRLRRPDGTPGMQFLVVADLHVEQALDAAS